MEFIAAGNRNWRKMNNKDNDNKSAMGMVFGMAIGTAIGVVAGIMSGMVYLWLPNCLTKEK